jgi:hypothetical protein
MIDRANGSPLKNILSGTLFFTNSTWTGLRRSLAYALAFGGGSVLLWIISTDRSFTHTHTHTYAYTHTRRRGLSRKKSKISVSWYIILSSSGK